MKTVLFDYEYLLLQSWLFLKYSYVGIIYISINSVSSMGHYLSKLLVDGLLIPIFIMIQAFIYSSYKNMYHW